jgi:putative tryptophan/tyrosine transport system substrate-binding protein
MRIDHLKRREFITLLGGAAALWPLALRAQQPAGAFQVGFLYPGPQAAAPSRIAAFSSGLQAGGVGPEQVTIVPRVTGGDPALLAPMAADLVGRKVDLITATSPAAIRAAQAATHTIPIVAGDLESDPVASGFVASHARPGGNITGMFLDFPDFSKKWLEALKEAVPQASTIGVFLDPATGPTQLKAVEAASETLDVKLAIVEVRGTADVEPAFQSITRQGARALLMLSSPFVGGNTKLLAGLAATHRLPAVTLFPDFARDGGLMAYGPNLMAYFRQQGVMAGKILHGAKAAELPIETPTKFEFVLNLKTAKLLGLTVPASILLRADEVIE